MVDIFWLDEKSQQIPQIKVCIRFGKWDKDSEKQEISLCCHIVSEKTHTSNDLWLKIISNHWGWDIIPEGKLALRNRGARFSFASHAVPQKTSIAKAILYHPQKCLPSKSPELKLVLAQNLQSIRRISPTLFHGGDCFLFDFQRPPSGEWRSVLLIGNMPSLQGVSEL